MTHLRAHEIAERGRVLIRRMRRAHRSELRNQSAVEFIDEVAREWDTLLDDMMASRHIRETEVRSGGAPKPRSRTVIVTDTGRVLTAETLFRADP